MFPRGDGPVEPGRADDRARRAVPMAGHAGVRRGPAGARLARPGGPVRRPGRPLQLLPGRGRDPVPRARHLAAPGAHAHRRHDLRWWAVQQLRPAGGGGHGRASCEPTATPPSASPPRSAACSPSRPPCCGRPTLPRPPSPCSTSPRRPGGSPVPGRSTPIWSARRPSWATRSCPTAMARSSRSRWWSRPTGTRGVAQSHDQAFSARLLVEDVVGQTVSAARRRGSCPRRDAVGRGRGKLTVRQILGRSRGATPTRWARRLGRHGDPSHHLGRRPRRRAAEPLARPPAGQVRRPGPTREAREGPHEPRRGLQLRGRASRTASTATSGTTTISSTRSPACRPPSAPTW